MVRTRSQKSSSTKSPVIGSSQNRNRRVEVRVQDIGEELPRGKKVLPDCTDDDRLASVSSISPTNDKIIEEKIAHCSEVESTQEDVESTDDLAGEPSTTEHAVEAHAQSSSTDKTTEHQNELIRNKLDSEKQSFSKRKVIFFPTEVTKIPADIMPITFGDNLKLPTGYIDAQGKKDSQKNMESLSAKSTLSEKGSSVKDSVITPDFERNDAAAGEKSWRKQLKERKAIREETGGKDWFNIRPPELTQDVKRDLKILQMRSVLDPKRFYKHNDRQAIPKYFQVGKVMDNAADFYSSRVPKKQRRQNLAEELLRDAEFQQYQKRKYNELVVQKKIDGAKRRKFKHKKKSSKQ